MLSVFKLLPATKTNQPPFIPQNPPNFLNMDKFINSLQIVDAALYDGTEKAIQTILILASRANGGNVQVLNGNNDYVKFSVKNQMVFLKKNTYFTLNKLGVHNVIDKKYFEKFYKPYEEQFPKRIEFDLAYIFPTEQTISVIKKMFKAKTGREIRVFILGESLKGSNYVKTFGAFAETPKDHYLIGRICGFLMFSNSIDIREETLQAIIES